MPDGDRFERRLRGKGWRAVYRLGCSGAPINAIADKVMGAVANVFRTESIECISKIFATLLEALDPLRNPLFKEALSHRAFEALATNVQAILTDEGFSEMSRMTERRASDFQRNRPMRTNPKQGCHRAADDKEFGFGIGRTTVSQRRKGRDYGEQRKKQGSAIEVGNRTQ